MARDQGKARILAHYYDETCGLYRLFVHVDDALVDEDGQPLPDAVLDFHWGANPVVPATVDLGIAQREYAAIHDRPLVIGETFVTDDEYVYLQVCQAMDVVHVLREKLRERATKPLALVGEGVTF